MAAENISDVNNLCITEDAFDEFQATSMNEEDDYITLSDIAPPETAAPDLSADMNEIPYDNEVVLASNFEGVEYELNSNSQSTIGETDLPPVSFSGSNVIVQQLPETNYQFHQLTGDDYFVQHPTDDAYVQQHVDQNVNIQQSTGKNVQQPSSDQSITKPKRGRKKKCDTTILNSAGNCESSIQSNYIFGNENLGSQTPITRSRRGRKPKISQISPNNNLVGKSPEVSKLPQSSVKKSPGKRGRPKKKPRGRRKILPKETIATDSVSQGVLENEEMSDFVSPAQNLGFDSLLKESTKRLSKGSTKKLLKESAKRCSSKRGRARVNKVSNRVGRPKRLPPEEIVDCEVQQEAVSVNRLSDEMNFSNDEEGDDISLSRLKETLDTTINNLDSDIKVKDTDTEVLLDVVGEDDNKPDDIFFKAKYEMLELPIEFEDSNSLVDKTIKNKNQDVQLNDEKHVPNENLLVEDSTKRPVRRKVKQTLQYDEGSDEDPFANIELSDDDEPRSKKKNRRYNSDDEYVPHGKRGKISSDDVSDSDIDDLEKVGKQKRKRTHNSGSVSKSPRKKAKNTENNQVSLDVTTVTPLDCDDVDDLEVCLQSSVIKASNDSKANWGAAHEFENFIAQKIHGTDLKIKKANKQSVPLEIPTLDTNSTKKFIEMCTQTNTVRCTTRGVQTSTPYDVPMKDNITLTPMQSAKACKFLTNVVKTTSELGQLMTQKSEDFITKKINTSHVTDTLKMDYCVKKSFLLFKLAKHNLIQMEEDLLKQYHDFLKTNGLESCIEEPKIIAPKSNAEDSDSDCEIVEAPVQKKQEKPKFNPKTVFLNKELSIKIAKKPSANETKKEKEKLNIKGRHTVWISDSVMVKKVKPTQSFLAQDSRNKKPPDCFVTEEMVSDFFKHYDHEKVQLICAPFTSRDWLDIDRNYICCYFYVKSDKFSGTSTSFSSNGEHCLNGTENNTSDDNDDLNDANSATNISKISYPDTLFALCTTALQKYMHQLNYHSKNNCDKTSNTIADLKEKEEPVSLFRLCLNILIDIPKIITNDSVSVTNNHTTNIEMTSPEVLLLKTLCYRKVKDLIDASGQIKTQEVSSQTIMAETYTGSESNELLFGDITSDYIKAVTTENHPVKSEEILSSPTVLAQISNNEWLCDGFNRDNDGVLKRNNFLHNEIKSLFSLCVKRIQSYHKFEETNKIMYQDSFLKPAVSIPECLKKIALDNIEHFLHKSSFSDENMNNTAVTKLFKTYKVKPLSYICFETVTKCTMNDTSYHKFEETNKIMYLESFLKPAVSIPECLKKIALDNIKHFLHKSSFSDENMNNTAVTKLFKTVYKVKPLSYICFETVTKCTMNDTAQAKASNYVYKVKRLSDICFEEVTKLIVDDTSGADYINNSTVDEFTINSVNTMSEEAFHNIGCPCIGDIEQSSEYLVNEEANVYNDDFDADVNTFEEDYQTDDTNWVSQVQMKELKSCFMSTKPSISGNQIHADEENTPVSEEQPILVRIKLEPPEQIIETLPVSSIVKAEHIANLDEMTVIPQSIVTKQESYDVDSFESFVRSNKIMHALTEFSNTSDDTFNQSAIKVRRQYDPDSDTENMESDPLMNLLVPQTFEPLNLETAKDHLMESSDDNSSKKTTGKKKADRRGRGRAKKTDTKQSTLPTDKEKVPPPPPPVNEVAKLTKRMREKIRQEEKKNESSDSDTDNIPLTLRKEKDRRDTKEKTKPGKTLNNEIQCNNVDSTEQIDYSVDENTETDKKFTGFTAVDQNEMSSYQKYVKFVYDKILPKVTEECILDKKESHEPAKINKEDESITNINEDNNRSSPLIDFDEPVELLECEPTLPIFDDTNLLPTRKVTNKTKTKSKVDKKTKHTENETISKEKETKDFKKDIPTFIERNGWRCYPIDGKDKKLYKNASIFLEKLPESFVDTYLRYQNITEIRKEDEEVDRLTNLQSLNRSSNVNVKEVKGKTKSKGRTASDEQSGQVNISRSGSPANSENYDELTPSEDEHNVNDEIPPSAPRQSSDNNLAKNSLMDDKESDLDDGENKSPKIKKELKDYIDEPLSRRKKMSKISPKKTEEKVPENPESLMLTADKMMNKELNLLHAPIVMNQDIPGSESKGPATRNKLKSRLRSRWTRSHIKAEDDSSSEEEKQWVNTKEKLLKRMGKKQDTASTDDAKRAKLVSEFIERRGDVSEQRKRGRGGRCRRSRKMMLEREKQLRVLSKELFGESAGDTSAGRGGKFSQSYFKGRRNIRKVIDKKSLARSTVTSNMEEFERKRRLIQRHNRLRELLGCEEGVNVLVINDEVCLEYDFETNQPIVTIHPFFTKVMKAHQYEGVKFMWDACFESLEKVESGHPGGGCILAHCMGLGKTLQVLALLHTVLTHPRVGMQRVLVCCPLSTVLNWVDEIHKWIGPVTDQIKVFELSKLKKTYERAYQLEDWYSGGGIFIIGYELFRSLSTLDPILDDIRPTIVNKIRTALLDPGPDIIVCDEGHLLKNDCSVLAVAMSRVVTKRRIVLTGTPMQNNLREYYCMVNFIKPNLLGTYPEYSNRFENPIMNGQHRDSQEEDIKLMKQRTHILHKVLEGCLQRQEASVLYPYLPKKHEYTVFISLTKCQWDLYKHYMQNYAKQSKQSILKDFHILQKIWSHPQVLHNFQMRTRDESGNKIKPEKLEDDLATEDLAASEDIKPSDTEVWWLQYLDGGKMLDALSSSNKFAAVFRILDECVALGDKVLIFSTSLITMDSLEFFLKNINKWSLGQDYYRLDGSVPPEVRQKWCREFNAENNLKTKLFLISTRAGSLGLNMVAANRVIILDTSWNPAHDIQSIFRVYRFGQKKDCYIYRLVAMGTMEQKIYERSVTKQAVACRVVDEQQIDRHYNMAELTELYRFDASGVSVAGGVAVGVTDVALLRVARHAALHAVHEHDSLLRGSSEQSLPEHERAAAWNQFQQEHAHKQMQNNLALKIKIPLLKLPLDNHEIAGPSMIQPPEVKIENPGDTNYVPPPEKAKKGRKAVSGRILQAEELIDDTLTKGKRGRKRLPVAGEEPLTENLPVDDSAAKTTVKSKRGRKRLPVVGPLPENQPVDDSIVMKIMNILIHHNFQNRQTPKEISDLVSNVRKFVAYGNVPTGTFNKQLTESIASVLLGKESVMPALTDVDPEQSSKKERKGNEKEDIPSTSKEAGVDTEGKSRRKAAIAAERHFDAMADEAVIELDGDDDWHGGSDTESAPEVVPLKHESAPEVLPPKNMSYSRMKKEVPQNNTENQTESITLSDDDEPMQTTIAVDAGKPTESKIPEAVIPLHPSLLSNNNFIKIVAHTYLEGNPMMDEDAATLAARYSTQKALKEFQSTGKNIDSGPIYDIAVKVLGKDILQKLQKSNLTTKTTAVSAPIAQAPIKAETSEPKTKPMPRVKAKGISDMITETPKLVKPVEMAKPLEMSNLSVTKFSVAPNEGSTPTVVPVGLFKRLLNVTPDEPEESILPDDDDIHIVSDPTPAPPATPQSPPPNLTRNRRGQPIILNKYIAKGTMHELKTTSTSAGPLTNLPKLAPRMIKLSASKVIVTQSASAVTTGTGALNAQPIEPRPVPVENILSSHSTICLDSDDDDSTPKAAPVKPKRGVALKSTAKKQVADAIKQVVPVSLTAANPDLNSMLSQPMPFNQTAVINPQKCSLMTLSQIQQLPANSNYVVIPQVNQLTNLPNAVLPPTQNVTQGTFTPQGFILKNHMPQNMNLINSIPNNTNMMTQVPQSMNLTNSMGKNVTLVNSMSQLTNVPMSMMNMMPQMSVQPQVTSSQMNAIPQIQQHVKQNVHTESILPTKTAPAATKIKTLCKPGDILRITDTGQVEILNNYKTSGDIVVDDSLRTKTNPAATTSDVRPSRKIKQAGKKAQRSRKVESSSSSSDSSRPSSPDDPLSILKDVVHIRAPDDDSSKHGSLRKDRSNVSLGKQFIGNTSITKSLPISTTSKNSTPAKNSVTITSSNDKVTKQINKAGTALKMMDGLLDSKHDAKASSSANKINTSANKISTSANKINTSANKISTSANKISTNKASANTKKSCVESVDLTDTYTPSTSRALKLSKDIIDKTNTQAKSSKTQQQNNEPSKIVGISKNIIITGNGKATKMSTRDQGVKKAIQVTNVDNIVSASISKPWNEPKKRISSAETSAPKRKRTEPMTLKDFDLDDIDDIIELE